MRSKTVLDHQIDSDVYSRQVLAHKLTNFENRLPLIQSELARDVIKDPYIFELEGIKEICQKDIEKAMTEKNKECAIGIRQRF